MNGRPVFFPSDGEHLAGELALPDGRAPFPGLLIIGGTLSDTRDGDPAGSLEGRLPRHGLLRVIAETAATAGFASLRWDKRGVGESTGGDRDQHASVETDVADALSALEALAGIPEVNPAQLVVLGESAGAYFGCLLAERSDLPSAYILQGALYQSISALYKFNFERIERLKVGEPAETSPLRDIPPAILQRYRHGPASLQAALDGAENYSAVDEGEEINLSLRRLKFELQHPPATLFRHVQKPTLVIQGDRDMNVPPEDCFAIAEALKKGGNRNVTLIVVPNADHSMQESPADPEIRLRERLSFESFHRPYSGFYIQALQNWLAALFQ